MISNITHASIHTTNSQKFYLGCAVWAHRGWLGSLYPFHSQSRDFLRLYSQRLTTVEGNTTFYATPTPATVKRWAKTMTEGFKLCPKLPQLITHYGQLSAQISAAQAFARLMQGLNIQVETSPSSSSQGAGSDHLGPIFAQLPPTYSPANQEDLATFLQAWPAETQLALEVRHPQWFEPSIHGRLDQLLATYQVSRVILDSRPVYAFEDDPQVASQRRKPQLPLVLTTPASVVLVRYIGHPTLRSNMDFLQEWVDLVKTWLGEGKTIYFFVHCPDETQSPLILQKFQALLEQNQVPVPPLPWNQLPPEPSDTQLSLF